MKYQTILQRNNLELISNYPRTLLINTWDYFSEISRTSLGRGLILNGDKVEGAINLQKTNVGVCGGNGYCQISDGTQWSFED